MIKAGIIGATGYTGVELIRLLLNHKQVELHCITSRSEKGVKLDDCFPSFRGETDLVFEDHDTQLLYECEVVFFATPNATAMYKAAAFLERGIKVIDLSADYRLKDTAIWEQWYGEKHASPELLVDAVYGLPEINRDKIRTAHLVANPGCYPTAISLGLLPLLENKVIDINEVIADAKSGVSGAGRKSALGQIFCEVDESFKAYAVSGHRHLPEILQTLQSYSDSELDLTFVPHLVPMVRGIEATLYARLNTREIDVQGLYTERYKDEAFVDVMTADSHPDTRSVKGTNLCRIALHLPGDSNRIVILSVIDNLIKGAAGQALQNMNIMSGLEETTGLDMIASVP